jgi:hypothetical protein
MEIRAYDEYPFGFSWVIDETMRRTSHALMEDGRVWLVDPVDAPEAIARAEQLGEIGGVIQLLDRHNRDAAELAERYGVPHLNVPDAVPGSALEAIPVLRLPRWRETALWWPEHKALVVAEAVGTAPFFRGGKDRTVGMHMLLRPLPPKRLRGYQPEHLLVGHGKGVHGAAAAPGLEEAHRNARRDLPKVLKSLVAAAKPG